MPGSKADYMENDVLNYYLRASGAALPANVFVSLFTVAPTDAGGGTEVTGGAYTRQAISRAAASWAAPVGGATENSAAINYPTATVAWGTVVAFAIHDALTAGNILYWGDLAASKVVGVGDTFSFAIGAIDITEQ